MRTIRKVLDPSQCSISMSSVTMFQSKPSLIAGLKSLLVSRYLDHTDLSVSGMCSTVWVSAGFFPSLILAS